MCVALPNDADSFPGGFFRGIFFGVGLLGVAGDASTRRFSTALLCTKERTNTEARSHTQCIYIYIYKKKEFLDRWLCFKD